MMNAAMVVSVVATANILVRVTAAVTDRFGWPSRDDGPTGSYHCYTLVEASQLIGVAGLTLWIVTLVEGALGQGYPLWQLGEFIHCLSLIKTAFGVG